MKRPVGHYVPRSLRSRLLLLTLIVLAAVLIIVGLLQYVFLKQVLYQNKADMLERQIETVPRDFWERLYSGARKDGGKPPFLLFPGSSVSFIDNEGNYYEIATDERGNAPVRLSDERYKTALAQPAKRERNNRYDIVEDDDDYEQLVVLRQVGAFDRRPLGLLQIGTRTAPMKQELLRQSMLFSLLAVFALALGFAALLPLLRRTLWPLSRVVGTMEQVNSARLDERLPEASGPTEVQRLARSFNGMLARLQDSFRAEQEAKEQMRRFVADASHELRTPLTSIHGFLEVLLRGAAGNPEQLRNALESMLGESERMNKLVRDLLTLAKLDRAPDLHLEEADLSAILEAMEPLLRVLADGRSVVFELSPQTHVRLDADKIKQVILNLFHNAVQHTDFDDGVITVKVLPVAGAVKLIVADNGSGIPESHLPRLFERFYRIDASRSRRSGGAGLGLSITKTIVDLHGGTITVNSAPGEGSVFCVSLPI